MTSKHNKSIFKWLGAIRDAWQFMDMFFMHIMVKCQDTNCQNTNVSMPISVHTCMFLLCGMCRCNYGECSMWLGTCVHMWIHYGCTHVYCVLICTCTYGWAQESECCVLLSIYKHVICMSLRQSACMCLCLSLCISRVMCAHLHKCLHVSMFVYFYLCMCEHISVYLWLELMNTCIYLCTDVYLSI